MSQPYFEAYAGAFVPALSASSVVLWSMLGALTTRSLDLVLNSTEGDVKSIFGFVNGSFRRCYVCVQCPCSLS